MRRSEYEERLEELNKQIEELKNVEIEEDGFWKPEHMNDYWYIDSFGKVFKDRWNDSRSNFYSLCFGNVFKTKEEAEFEAERLRVYRELRQYSSNGKLCKDYFYLGYDIFKKDIVYVKVSNSIIRYGDLCFESKELTEKAVESVGKDKVLKYYLEIEEQ